MNQSSNFLWGSFSNRNNAKLQSNLEKEDNPRILKDNFSSTTDPTIFLSIAP